MDSSSLETMDSLAVLAEEIKGKQQLKERDGNVFYEDSEREKKKYEEIIMKMRRENKVKRKELAIFINGDKDVIRSAFLFKRDAFLAIQRQSAPQCIQIMDEKICEQGKNFDALDRKLCQRREELDHLKDKLEIMRADNAIDFAGQREKEIRRLQNELDKAMLKTTTARNITEKYEAIFDKLQQEIRNYPGYLDGLENKLKQMRTELDELSKIGEKAVKASLEFKYQRDVLERDVMKRKKARDKELNALKKDVERRKEAAERVEKKTKIPLVGERPDPNIEKFRREKIERQKKILKLEEAFEQLKDASRVSDMDDIVYRLLHQDETFKKLRKIEKENKKKKSQLVKTLEKLKTRLHDLKFSSKMQETIKLEDDMAVYTEKEVERSKVNVETYQGNNELLIHIQNGIVTLLDKLKAVRLKPPLSNFMSGDPIKDLELCAEKLSALLKEVGLGDDPSAPLPRVHTEKLKEFVEKQLPGDNIRVPQGKDMGDESDSDNEFDMFPEQDLNKGFKSRQEIKRHSQDILKRFLQPAKKDAKKAAA